LGSSSLFSFYLHSAAYPSIQMSNRLQLITTTLDIAIKSASIELEDFTYLVLDVQGAELEVLQGAKETLSGFDVIMVEVSIRELYKGAPLFKDIYLWMELNGFVLVDSYIDTQVGWGDALFIRGSVLATKYPWIDPATKFDFPDSATWAMRLRQIFLNMGIPTKFLSRSFLKKIFFRE